MSDHMLRFGPFQLDVARRELLRDGELMKLGGRALDILCVLASARGKVEQGWSRRPGCGQD